MDRKRKTPFQLQPHPKNKTRKIQKLLRSHSKPTRPDKTVLLISSEDSDSDREIPETPSPGSVISASSPEDPQTSIINMIEEYQSSPEDNFALAGCSTAAMEKSLIQAIEEYPSSEEFDATTLIESGSEPPSQEHRQLLPRVITDLPPRIDRRKKDPVNIPFIYNPPKHPLSIIATQPSAMRNGLEEDLRKMLNAYRSKENYWHFDNKLGIVDADTEVVYVKSIKKFYKFCLLVDIQRERAGDSGTPQLVNEGMLLNLHWDPCFQALQSGDKLMVNFREAAPIQLLGRHLHTFPFVRKYVERQEPIAEGEREE